MRARVAGLVAAAVLLAACGSTPGPTPAPTAAADLPPVSHDPPIGMKEAIHPPSEPREAPKGPLAYVVDSRAYSVYEYDLGRGRFLGPAPRMVTTADKVVTLPGYPTVVGTQPPQQAAVSRSWLYVAGGIEGTVVVIPRLPDLGRARPVHLPAVSVQRDALYGGGSASNATETGAPLVSMVVALGDDRVVAVSQDRGTGTSVAYLVESASGRLLRSAQIPDGTANAVAGNGEGFVVGMNEGRLVVVDRSLSALHSYPLRGNPRGVAVDGSQAVVSSIALPGHPDASTLEVVDLSSGADRQLRSLSNPYSGPVAIEGSTVWWALGDLSQVRGVPLGGGTDRVLGSCRYINSVAVARGSILATCLEHNQLAVIDIASGHRRLLDAGGFPDSVVAPGG